MINVGLLVAGSLLAGLVAFAGCSGGGAGTGGTGGGGASTSAGAGGGVPVPEWQCAVPAAPPSKGACVAFTAPDGGPEADAGLDTMGNAGVTTCNPVTGAGCAGTDHCTYDQALTHYYCEPAGSPSAVALCGDCTADAATCGPDLLCVGDTPTSSICVAACCDDTDCAPGRCDKTMALVDPLGMGVGVCVQ